MPFSSISSSIPIMYSYSSGFAKFSFTDNQKNGKMIIILYAKRRELWKDTERFHFGQQYVLHCLSLILHSVFSA